MTRSIPLPKMIWCKIRYFQQLNGISKEKLAEEMSVHPRTISNYDNRPENITLSQIDCFLRANGLEFKDLI